jgi:hypothetical protein
MPDFTVTQPYRGLYHVVFPLRPGRVGEVDLAFHFMRFQEHYESPGFKGTLFSWAQYVAWYKRVRGAFSYADDWGGFNLPGTILTPFRQGAFDPLTRRERALLQALAAVRPQDYVIGTLDDDPEALAHELAHAFWHLDGAYRAQAQAILAGGDYTRQHARLAEGEGYDPMVYDDEIQACAVDGDGEVAPDAARCQALRGLFETTQARLRQRPVATP